MQRAVAELERTRANLLQVGTVSAVDYPRARVRVLLAGVSSAWLPWLAARAGAVCTWSPPIIGEQVLVACPDGEPAAGVVLGSLYRDTHAAPAQAQQLHRMVYADGARVEYDQGTHQLTVDLPAGATLRIVAGTVTIEGDLNVTGTVNATVDCVTGTNSLRALGGGL